MISQRLKQFLEQENVPYQVIEASGSLPLGTDGPGKDWAKIIIVRAGTSDVMVVIPASCELDLEKLCILFDASEIAVENEDQYAALFPDCEAGAMPAIGRLYGLSCLVDETLLDGPSVCFKGGSHREWVRISSDEYWRIAQAEVGDFRLRKVAA